MDGQQEHTNNIVNLGPFMQPNKNLSDSSIQSGTPEIELPLFDYTDTVDSTPTNNITKLQNVLGEFSIDTGTPTTLMIPIFNTPLEQSDRDSSKHHLNDAQASIKDLAITPSQNQKAFDPNMMLRVEIRTASTNTVSINPQTGELKADSNSRYGSIDLQNFGQFVTQQQTTNP